MQKRALECLIHGVALGWLIPWACACADGLPGEAPTDASVSAVAMGAEAEGPAGAVSPDDAGDPPSPPEQPALSRAEVSRLVERVAQRHRLDRDLVDAVIRAESGYDARAVSPAGAVGLMQVMPATATEYGVLSEEALFDPHTNLDTGMRHLRRLLDKYGSIGHALMAYNAGEGALERGGGFVTYPETQRYTHAVVMSYLRRKGIEPYTPQARQVIGMDVTPAMARAAAVVEPGRTPAAETPAEPTAPRPVTRLSSRLAPALSRGDGSEGADRRAPLSTGTRVLDRNRARFASDR